MKTAACPISAIFPATSPGEAKVLPDSCRLEHKVFSTVAEIPQADWHALVPETEPFLRPEFLNGIEAGNAGQMGFRYVLLYANRKPVAFAYYQLLTFDVGMITPFTEGNLPSGFISQLKYRLASVYKAVIRNRKVRLLVNGNAFLSGEHGFYYSPTIAPKEAFQILLNLTDEIRRTENGNFAGVVVKDFHPGETHPHSLILDRGYHEIRSEPVMRFRLSDDWHNFLDYLDALSSKYRQRAKSTYKKSRQIERREMDSRAILNNRDTICRLFCQVIKEDSFSLTQPSDTYFESLKRELGDDFLVYGYYLGDTLIGFKTLVHTGDKLEAHFLGFEPDLNRTYKLYQRMLYDIVETGISLGVREISFGRTAMEIKSTIGALGFEMYSYLKLSNPFFNRLIGPIMRNLKIQDWTPRHPFKSHEGLEESEEEDELAA
jgi:predicted N-acyltransferase